MWIRGNTVPVLGPRGLTAVDITWSFDEYNSTRFIEDFDSDSDGTLDPDETETLRRESLSGLYRYEYYLIVDIGGLRGTPLEAVNFQATISDGRLVYSFRVPLEITIRWEDMEKVGIYLFDPAYFVDFRSDEMENLTVTWEGNSVGFKLARQELETQGYGKVSVTGLQAGGVPTGSSSRLSLSAWIKDRSFLLQERLASYTRRVVDERDRAAFLSALALSVVFGMLHVMGPGHGKIFTLAYFSSKSARPGEGLMLSALINILDSLSAFLLVGLTYGVLSLTIQNTGAVVGRITRIVAYSAIFLIGIGHVLAHILEHGKKGTGKRKQLKPWMLALSVGLIPCPVSSALLAYGMAAETIWFSLILVAGVSLGGMIALSLYSLLIIAGKAGLVRIVENHGAARILGYFDIFSMALLAAFGLILLIGII
jgi:ABC-type nickel/cobalt efflux system permease component RcnA